MSSIIKSNRILNETMIDLGKQKVHRIERVEEQEEMPEVMPAVDTEALYIKAQAEVMTMIKEAEDRANKLLEQAELQIQEKYQSADAEMAKRQEEMEQVSRQMCLEAEQKANDLLQEAYDQKERIIQEAEPEVVSLVQQLVGHIIHEEVTKHTEWVGLLVEKIRRTEALKERLEMYLSEETYDKLTEEDKRSIEKIGEGVRVKVDEQLAQWACRIETSHGSIVYDIAEGLQKVMKEIQILQSL